MMFKTLDYEPESNVSKGMGQEPGTLESAGSHLRTSDGILWKWVFPGEFLGIIKLNNNFQLQNKNMSEIQFVPSKIF